MYFQQNKKTSIEIYLLIITIFILEGLVGFEPTIRELQSHALPLGYRPRLCNESIQLFCIYNFTLLLFSCQLMSTNFFTKFYAVTNYLILIIIWFFIFKQHRWSMSFSCFHLIGFNDFIFNNSSKSRI